jgi:Bacterial regulatory proteins, tetR family
LMSERALRAPTLKHTVAVRATIPSPRSSTKDLLIETGERLFGQYGFDGISLREIAAVAGQGNCNAVQYHFKDKRGFISAILNDRVTRADVLRRERLESLESTQKIDSPRELLKIIWLPDLALVGTDGSHSHCRFQLKYLLQPDVGLHPFYRIDARSRASTVSRKGHQSCLLGVTGRLRTHYKHLSQKMFYRRITTLSMMFLTSVVEHDNTRVVGKDKTHSEYDAKLVLDMSIGALSAPE